MKNNHSKKKVGEHNLIKYIRIPLMALLLIGSVITICVESDEYTFRGILTIIYGLFTLTHAIILGFKNRESKQSTQKIMTIAYIIISLFALVCGYYVFDNDNYYEYTSAIPSLIITTIDALLTIAYFDISKKSKNN